MDVVNIDTQMGFAFFTIITTVYFILNYFVGRPSKVKNGAMASLSLLVCYFLLIATSQFLLNLQLTAGMCNDIYQYTTAVYALIPWVLIFGIISLLLTVFPGWLSPFSNTLGYLMTTMLGIKKLIRDVFKEPGSNDNKAKETLQYIYGNQSLLINEITISNFEIFKDTMKDLIRPEAMSNSNTEDKDKITKMDKLKDMVYLKELVAQYVWYILSGSLTIAIATNSIITSTCNYSEEEYSQLSGTP